MNGSRQPPHRSPPIVQFWDAEPIPRDIAELIASFRRLNPDLPHLTFSESTARGFIADHFSAREVAAFSACAVPAMQADYFRYCAVLALGGIYADADFRCLVGLRPLVDAGGGEIFLRPRPHILKGRTTRWASNGFFAFPSPGHPFLRVALDIATANVEARIAERIWPAGQRALPAIILTTGPGIFTLMRVLRQWGSFDAFIEAIAGSQAEPFGQLYCEAVGDYDRIVGAFEGVRSSPHEKMLEWVCDPDERLPHKGGDTYWMRVKTPIFR